MSDNRLKIRGLGSIVLKDENPKPEKEYLISIRAELRKIEKDVSDKDNPFFTFIFEYLNTELIQEIGTAKKLKVEHGKTQSQILRWIIESLAEKLGQEREFFYQKEMSKIIESYKLQLE